MEELEHDLMVQAATELGLTEDEAEAAVEDFEYLDGYWDFLN